MLIHNRYRVIQETNRSAAATTLLVADTWREDKHLALRLLPPCCQEDLARLRYEFAVLSQLKHPGLFNVYDFGILPETQQPFYTMDLIEGEPLSAYAARQRQASPHDFTWLYLIAAQLARMLHYLHARGLMHYAVAPSHIHVTTRGQVKVDLPGAIHVSPALDSLRLPESLIYSAPELVRGEAVDARSSLYTLGAILYTCLTAALPALDETYPAFMRHHLDGPAIPPLRVPPDLQRLIHTLLAREPQQRYPHINAFLAALADLSGLDLPPEPQAPRPGYIHSLACVGREAELQALQGALQRTAQGESAFLLITGPAGVGKSRLLRELRLRAQALGVWVMEARPTSAAPYNLWRSVLHAIVSARRLTPAEALHDYGPIVALLLPDGAETEAPRDTDDIPALLADLVARALVSMDWPLLLVLDDLHAADAESLALLAALDAHLPRARVCIAAACCTPDLPAQHPAATWQEALSDAWQRFDLAPLTPEQVTTWLQIMGFSGAGLTELAGYLHTFSHGLPRTLEFALHTLLEQIPDTASADAFLPLAQHLLAFDERSLWASRLARLDASTRDILRWAALRDAELDIGLLAQVSGVYPDQLFALLDRAVEAHLLWRGMRRGRVTYRFGTDWMRDLATADLAPDVRRAAHLRIAEKMERLPASTLAPETLAWHYAQAGRAARAIEHYRAAARQAERLHAWQAALRCYDAALALVQEPAPELIWELRQARASLWDMLGDATAQAQELAALVDVVPHLADPAREARLLLQRAQAEDARGQRAEALALVRAAGELARTHGFDEIEVDALTREGRLLCLMDQYAEAQRVLERALAMYAQRDDLRGEVEALRWLGETLRRQGNTTDALGAYNRVLELARWLGDLGLESDALNALGILTLDLARRRRFYEASLRWAMVIGDTRREARAYNNLGLIYWRLGRYEQARAYLERAVALQRTQRQQSGLIFALESLARVCLAQGDLEAARALLEEGLALSRKLATPLNEALYRMDWGLLAHAQGDLMAAREHLAEACALLRDVEMPGYLSVAASKLALVHLALGDGEAARAAADEAREALRVGGVAASFPPQEVWWDQYLVRRALGAQDARHEAEAQEALQNACELLLESAASMSDAGWRRIYLRQVPLHHHILEAWKQWQGRLPVDLHFTGAADELVDERMHRLHDLSLAMRRLDGLEALLDFVLDQTLELSGATRAFVCLLDDGAHPQVVTVRAHDPAHVPPPQPVLEAVLRSRAPLLIADVRRDERYALPVDVLKAGVRSLLAVPWLVREQVRGVLYVDLDDALPGFTAQDAEVLRLFAQHAAAALEGAQALRDVQRQMQDLEVLRQASLVLTSASDQATVLNGLLDAVARLFPDMRHAHVFLDRRGELSFAASLWADGTRGRLAAPPRPHGLTYMVAQQGRLMAISSLRHHPLFADLEGIGEGAMMGVPLKVGERLVGVLTLTLQHARAFDEHTLHLLRMLADHTGVALESVRLLDEVQANMRQLAALNAISRDISSTLDLPRVLERIAGHARNLMQADECEIYLLDADRKLLRPIVALGPFAELVKQRPIRVGEGVIGSIAQSGVSELVADTSRDPRVIRIPGTPDAHALMGVVLRARGELLGVMSLARSLERGPFPPDALELMANLAQQAAVAIENARLYWNERQLREETAQALEELRRLEQVKDQFIQNVSHELRTPITLVHGYAELMRSGALGPLTPEQDEALEVIQRRTTFLTEMVTDFTMLIEIKARGLRTEWLDVPALLHETVATARPAAEAAQLTLEAHIPARLPKIRGDVVYLRRVLDNLLSNAVKFTPAGGRITLRAWREDKHVCIAVADTGIGIPASEHARIFNRFYQVDGSTTRQYGGTGLGLAVVKEIVEAHGGSVSLESAVGQGTTFTVRLPIP